MKAYKQKVLNTIAGNYFEVEAALGILKPSMPLLLDYQIARLERTIALQPTLPETSLAKVTPATLAKWERTLALLAEARALYN